MLHYIIQTVSFQLVFLLVYDLFLKKETFFNYNRIYLLTTAALSFVLPLIKIDRLKSLVPEEFVIRLPEVVIGEIDKMDNLATPLDALVIEPSSFSILTILFFLGLGITLTIFLRKLFRLYTLSKINAKQKLKDFTIISLYKSNAAFSFFNLVFMGDLLDEREKVTILSHERIHVIQKHSIDILIFEILRIIFWFNPFIYIYQNRISSLHEFIADSKAATHQNKSTYYENLLKQVFDVSEISFANTFFNHSLIKKRIIMLSKTKSKQILKLKYVLLIPAICCMLIYTSSSASENAIQETSVSQNSPITEKIAAIKKQIMVQGNITAEEEKGLALLLKTIESSEKNKALINEVQQFMSSKNKTPLMSKIADLFDQIQKQGNIAPFEERALKELLVLTTDNGLNNPLFIDVVESVEIPFGVIDEVPVYKSCEELTENKDRKKCMSKNIAMHVNKNFNTKLAESLGLNGRQRISVIFKIDKEGHVTEIRARAPHPKLEEEAVRVIGTLPQFIPGKHQGKAVIVPYSLPIVFQVNSNNSTDNYDAFHKDLTVNHTDAVPFAKVDQPPYLESCVSEEATETLVKCTTQGISKYVNRNFNMKIAEALKLTGRHRIMVKFKISKQGDATNVEARGPHPDLEEEAKRVVYTLPKFVPAKHQDKIVDVMYSLPIVFQIAQ